MNRRGGAAPGRTLAAVALVAAGVLAAPLLIGWGLEEPLRSALEARDVSVRLVGGPASLLTGRFASLTVVVHRARLGDVVVDEVVASLRGAQVDLLRAVLLRRLVVRHAAGGRASLRVRADDIRQALEDRPGVREAAVSVGEGGVQVAATLDILGHPVAVDGRATLHVVDGRRVVARVEQMRVGRLHLPPPAAAVLAAPLNPLVAVDRLPLPLTIRRLDVGEGTITVEAEPR